MSLNKITPKDILKIVKFNSEDKDWKYNKDKKDMYAYQAEGAAGIWNRLEHFGVAILADEVGMGKTYQALAVVALQFVQNPNSKILIITPRYEVLRQWKEEEYKQFRFNHLKDKKLFPKEEELDDLQNLAGGLNPSDMQIVFAKTTSFSQNVDIEQCQKDLKKFDLVIVDEAHKFKNYSTSSEENNNRNSNASKIFEGSNCKVLLMTATPLHSKKSDILNIVNVFKKEINNFPNEEKTSDSIMKYLMIRRLRVLAHGYNKYHYRKENDIEVEIKTKEQDYKDELFFALLQKKLIENSDDIDFSKSKHLLNILEGTTFDKEYHNENNKDEGFIKDKIFKKVVDKFHNAYNTHPSNQKYDQTLQKIWDSKEKALVFVRRRASAIELTNQYIKEFDKRAWALLSREKRIPKRESFDRVFKIKSIDNRVKEFINKKYVLEYLDRYKQVVDLPKGTKKKTILQNMANNYFDMFDDITEENLIKFMKEFELQEEHIETSTIKSQVLDFFKTKKKENSTAASRFVRKFDEGRAYRKFFIEWLPKELSYKDEPEEKKILIQSAILHASIGVVELFSCDIKTKNYDSFCKKVAKKLNKFQLKKEIESFLENFDKYEKYLRFNENSGNDENSELIGSIKVYDATIFHNAQPAYAYLSNTKNKSVIARFNSPFFPNMLCGTSTLQEGLNLHLQCNKVYHFGAAYSMGDDEQRTGRVDRIHGKMYRELYESKDAKLEINYPYLKNTFDEENLRGMLCSKRYIEKKIDNCKIEVCINSNHAEQIKNECNKSIKNLINIEYIKSENINKTEPFGWEM